jgi:membrane peptidoglycan carboxypeptidase
LPLGTIGISPLEMAGAYASIANGGIYNPPYYVDKVLDASGKVVIEHKPAGQRVMSDETARLATQVLQQVVLGGTGTRAKIPGRQVAGKTGTAQDETDAWFVGFTPQLSTAVWMGALDGKVPMFNVGGVKVFGGTYPARIWQAYMAQALNGQPVINFPKADGTRAGKYLHIKEEPDKPTATTRRRGPSPAPTATTTLSSTPPSDKGGKGGGGGDGHGHPTTTVGTGGGPPPTT